MNCKAQAGLEYLMTYGWALVLVATAIGVLVFITAGPSSEVTFSSSDPTKILFKGGSLDAFGNVEAVAQNITGGKIKITAFNTGGDFTVSTLNGVESRNISSSNPLEVGAGGELHL